MIEITFPDGASRSYEINSSPYEIASSISEGLARNIISANFNNKQLKHLLNLQKVESLFFIHGMIQKGKKLFGILLLMF